MKWKVWHLGNSTCLLSYSESHEKNDSCQEWVIPPSSSPHIANIPTLALLSQLKDHLLPLVITFDLISQVSSANESALVPSSDQSMELWSAENKWSHTGEISTHMSWWMASVVMICPPDSVSHDEVLYFDHVTSESSPWQLSKLCYQGREWRGHRCVIIFFLVTLEKNGSTQKPGLFL